MTVFRGAVLRERGRSRPYGISRPLEVVELELPDPGPDELLVKVEAASLCRSDLSVVTGARVWPLPMVVGHEAAGRIEAVGSGVARFEPGDKVVLIYLPQCGTCAACRAGKAWLCDVGMAANRKGELLTGGTRLVHDGEHLFHHMGVAAFAEYTIVAEASAVKVPPGLPAKELCVFGCAVLCGAGTALNTAGIASGETVAVVGLGAVGLSAILGARAAGAGRIIAIDRLEAKLPLARSVGATDTLIADGDATDRVAQWTDGGVDHAIEASGTVDGFTTCVGLVRRGGTVTTLGLPGPESFHELALASLVAGGITIRGSYLGSCIAARDVPRFISLYEAGELPTHNLVSHHIGLDDINEALDRLADGTALRQVIEF
ncbi:MAG: alcohol dehydrogenase catalytic domain-containing protein [Acidimicrobiia bacterium]